ncbi:MAG: hypothetical protein JST24_07980 [Acidobacteria bacterium]|nr:hypothetical protein [Acidobacteriota bacterium]
MRIQWIMLVALITSTGLWADGRSDLAAALGRLNGNGSVQAGIDFQFWTRQTLGKQSSVRRSEVKALVQDDAESLRVTWPKVVVGDLTLEEERAARGEVPATAIRDQMKELDPGRVHHLLDQATMLRRLMDQARFVSERADAWEGKPVRLLLFEFSPRVPDDKAGRLSRRSGSLKVWIAADGTPLASSEVAEYEGKMGRFLGAFQSKADTETRYAVMQGRLVAVHRETEENTSESGGAERADSRRVFDLKEKP